MATGFNFEMYIVFLDSKFFYLFYLSTQAASTTYLALLLCMSTMRM